MGELPCYEEILEKRQLSIAYILVLRGGAAER